MGVGRQGHRGDGENGTQSRKIAGNEKRSGEQLDYGTYDGIHFWKRNSRSSQDGLQGGGSDDVLNADCQERDRCHDAGDCE